MPTTCIMMLLTFSYCAGVTPLMRCNTLKSTAVLRWTSPEVQARFTATAGLATFIVPSTAS